MLFALVFLSLHMKMFGFQLKTLQDKKKKKHTHPILKRQINIIKFRDQSDVERSRQRF